MTETATQRKGCPCGRAFFLVKTNGEGNRYATPNFRQWSLDISLGQQRMMLRCEHCGRWHDVQDLNTLLCEVLTKSEKGSKINQSKT